MRFEPQKKNKLKVILSPKDLSSSGLTYAQLDYNDQRTRLLLSRLLDSARQKGIFAYPDQSRLLIELFPTFEGGCVIFFTVLDSQVFQERKDFSAQKIFAFSFRNLEDLGRPAARLDALKALPDPKECSCSLYRLQDEYRIVCQFERPVSPENYLNHPCFKELCKYGRPAGTGPVAAAYCEEHGELLAAQDALKKLAMCWK